MKKYKLYVHADGSPFSKAVWLTLPPVDLLVAEYRHVLKAKELFRDIVHHEGLWDTYRRQLANARALRPQHYDDELPNQAVENT